MTKDNLDLYDILDKTPSKKELGEIIKCYILAGFEKNLEKVEEYAYKNDNIFIYNNIKEVRKECQH